VLVKNPLENATLDNIIKAKMIDSRKFGGKEDLKAIVHKIMTTGTS